MIDLYEPAPDADTYEIGHLTETGDLGLHIMTFRCGGMNGKSPRDTAIGEMANMSETADGPLVLVENGEEIATAEFGCVTMTEGKR